MVRMDKQYANALKQVTGSKLVVELRNIITGITEEDWQRTRDRGCYLVLENIGRVEDLAQQELLITKMLANNPKPSSGVRRALVECWTPLRLPAKEVRRMLIEILPLDKISKIMRNIADDEPWHSDMAEELISYFLEHDRYEEAIALTHQYAQDQIPDLLDNMVKRLIHRPPVESKFVELDTGYAEELTAQEIQNNLLPTVVEYAVNYKAKKPLVTLRASAVLHCGNRLRPHHMLPAAVLLEDIEWQETATERVCALLTGYGGESYWYGLARDAFELVKDERLARHRGPLFASIMNGRIKSVYHHFEYMRIAAEMAVYFERHDWQGQCYTLAVHELQSGTYDRIAYEALEILALVHEASRQKIASTTRPPEKFILR